MQATAPLRRSIALELLIVGMLAALFVGMFTERPRYVDLVAAVLALGLIALSARRSAAIWHGQPRARQDATIRRRLAFRAAAAFTLPAVGTLLLAGVALGYAEGGWTPAFDRITNWHIIVAVLLYFPWALLQQFIFQFYLLGRLLAVAPPWAALGLTAMAFSAVHFPRAPVMAATAIAGFVWALNYREYRSLLPLAVSHAMLGAALHYWVLGNDLLARWLG